MSQSTSAPASISASAATSASGSTTSSSLSLSSPAPSPSPSRSSNSSTRGHAASYASVPALPFPSLQNPSASSSSSSSSSSVKGAPLIHVMDLKPLSLSSLLPAFSTSFANAISSPAAILALSPALNQHVNNLEAAVENALNRQVEIKVLLKEFESNLQDLSSVFPVLNAHSTSVAQLSANVSTFQQYVQQCEIAMTALENSVDQLSAEEDQAWTRLQQSSSGVRGFFSKLFSGPQAQATAKTTAESSAAPPTITAPTTSATATATAMDSASSTSATSSVVAPPLTVSSDNVSRAVSALIPDASKFFVASKDEGNRPSVSFAATTSTPIST